METLLFLYLTFGALLVVLSIPLLRNKIPPNGLYGFRIPKTMNNPPIWYAVNHYFSKYLLATGCAIALASTIFYFIPGITLDQYALIILGVFGGFFGFGIVKSVRFMNRLPVIPAQETSSVE